MRLIKPTTTLREAYLDMLSDWHRTGEEVVPFPLRFDTTDFDAFVNKMRQSQTIADEGFVTHSTFWLVTEEDIIVGVSNLRHYLNESLLISGGHIGYGIRPSKRRKGYATKILELSLLEAKKRGITKALLSCYKSNIASAKTILKNGGVFRSEAIIDDKEELSFWIEIK